MQDRAVLLATHIFNCFKTFNALNQGCTSGRCSVEESEKQVFVVEHTQHRSQQRQHPSRRHGTYDDGDVTAVRAVNSFCMTDLLLIPASSETWDQVGSLLKRSARALLPSTVYGVLLSIAWNVRLRLVSLLLHVHSCDVMSRDIRSHVGSLTGRCVLSVEYQC